MKNLSPIKKLTALALAAPTERPFDEYLDTRPWCPLRRASYAAGDTSVDLVEFAVELGFTRAEAHGLMRGYDRATGQPVCFDHIAEAWPRDVARGERMGARLATLLGAVAEAA